ncbi:MAG: guanosine monophosphate reductase, partial [Candidatus Hermodarchaeia archaeon]
MKIRQGLTFDDVLLVPQHSNIRSRSAISLSVDLGKGIELGVPIVSANMKDITEIEMAHAVADFGGLPILHRFTTISHQIDMLRMSKNLIGCSVGVNGGDYEHACAFVDSGCSVLCVDVAHGDHALSLDMVERIAKGHPDVLLIAGNVATAGGARRLCDAGADVIKVGIGPGSLCTTRVETGNGVPQMTALEDIFIESCSMTHEKFLARADIPAKPRKFKIIADGGIRNAGDCVKALCFSDAVMLG